MTQLVDGTVEESTRQARPPTWPWSLRIGFRFGVVYLALFCLGTPQILLAWLNNTVQETSDYWANWLMRPLVGWVATHVLGLRTAPRWTLTGSGDTTLVWVSLLCWVVIAVAVTVLWSAVAGRRFPDPTVLPWFRVALRLLLAGQMLSYGFAKAFPLQMPSPSLTELTMPVGDFDRMQMLWLSMGASHPYEIATGCAEILGGVLLLLPRTTSLGALICAVDMAQVFILNMTYDIPVKILSFHLLLMSLFLLAPAMGRLLDFFVRDRAVPRALSYPLFRSRRANRVALAVQLLLGLWIVGSIAQDAYHTHHAQPAKSALYGVWEVDEFTLDGTERPPLTTDPQRWQRVLFDNSDVLLFQHMNGSIDGYFAAIDTAHHRITLRDQSNTLVGTLSFQCPTTTSLDLTGPVRGRPVTVRLSLIDLATTYPLVGPGFHWIHDGPA